MDTDASGASIPTQPITLRVYAIISSALPIRPTHHVSSYD